MREAQGIKCVALVTLNKANQTITSFVPLQDTCVWTLFREGRNPLGPVKMLTI